MASRRLRGLLSLLAVAAVCAALAGCTGGPAGKKSAAPGKTGTPAAPVERKAAPKEAPNAAAPKVADLKAPKLPTPTAPPPAPVATNAIADSSKLEGEMDDLLRAPEPYYYQSVGRRDIFESLVSEEGKVEEVDAQGLTSSELRVVGILWAENDRFALVETPQGRSQILREGSALGDGTVERILPDKVLIHVTEYGTSRRVTLPLEQGGDSDETPGSRRR